MTIKPFMSVLVLASVFLSGCLATVPNIDAQHSSSIQTKQSIANGIQNPKIDASGVLVTSWVRNAMMSAFAMRAAHLGLRIDPNGVPVTIILRASERNPMPHAWSSISLTGPNGSVAR